MIPRISRPKVRLGSDQAIVFLPMLMLVFIAGLLPSVSQTQLFRWHALDVIVLIIGVFSLIIYRPKSDLWSAWYRPVLIFLAFSFVTLPLVSGLTGFKLAYAYLYALRWGGYSCLLFYSILISKRFPQLLLTGIWLAILGIGILGLVQYLVVPDIRPLTTYGWDPHYYRLVSTFLDPGFTGLILVLGLVIGYTLIKLPALRLSNTLTPKRIYICLFVLIIALLLTYSRASYLAYFVGLTSLAYTYKTWRLLIIGSVIFCLGLIIIPHSLPSEGVKLNRQSTIIARLITWKQGVDAFVDQPLAGIGFNAYRFYAQDHGYLSSPDAPTHAGNAPDSSFLLVMATTGLIGFSLYLYIHYCQLKLSTRTRTAYRYIIPIWLVITVHSFFLNSWFYGHTLVIWYLVLGLALTWHNSPTSSS